MASPNPIEELTTYYDNLSSRDRGLLAVIGTALVAFLVFLTGLSLSRNAQKREDRIGVKMQQLREVSQLTVGYRQAESARNELERKLKDHAVRNLLSYLEDLAKKDGLDISSMSDKGSQPVGDKGSKIAESAVEVTLTHVQLDKLTKFLNDAENNPGLVKVTRLQVRPREDDAVLDAYFTVSTYSLGS